jgi:hypothetical protein
MHAYMHLICVFVFVSVVHAEYTENAQTTTTGEKGEEGERTQSSVRSRTRNPMIPFDGDGALDGGHGQTSSLCSAFGIRAGKKETEDAIALSSFARLKKPLQLLLRDLWLWRCWPG